MSCNCFPFSFHSEEVPELAFLVILKVILRIDADYQVTLSDISHSLLQLLLKYFDSAA